MQEHISFREILIDNPSAPIRHFEPDDKGRDRYGNRLFSSPRLAYNDRLGQITKASILVSPFGERLIKQFPGLLRAVDAELTRRYKSVANMDDPDVRVWPYAHRATISDGLMDYNAAKLFKASDQAEEASPPLPYGARLQMYEFGYASFTHLLEVDNQKYILKTPQEMVWRPIHQPYINEMLQFQSLSADLSTEFHDLCVSLPTYLFASSRVGCVEFASPNPDINHSDHIYSINDRLVGLVSSYINGHSNIDLWRNIHVDDYVLSERNRPIPNFSNFIATARDHVVWIDPIYYKHPNDKRS